MSIVNLYPFSSEAHYQPNIRKLIQGDTYLKFALGNNRRALLSYEEQLLFTPRWNHLPELAFADELKTPDEITKEKREKIENKLKEVRKKKAKNLQEFKEKVFQENLTALIGNGLPLTKKDVETMAKSNQLDKLRRQLTRKGYSVEFTDTILSLLLKQDEKEAKSAGLKDATTATAATPSTTETSAAASSTIETTAAAPSTTETSVKAPSVTDTEVECAHSSVSLVETSAIAGLEKPARAPKPKQEQKKSEKSPYKKETLAFVEKLRLGIDFDRLDQKERRAVALSINYEEVWNELLAAYKDIRWVKARDPQGLPEPRRSGGSPRKLYNETGNLNRTLHEPRKDIKLGEHRYRQAREMFAAFGWTLEALQKDTLGGKQ